MINIGIWTHILIEGYCMFSYDKEHTKHLKSKRPEWCKKEHKGKTEHKPQKRCMYTGENGKMCPYFAFAESEEEVEMLFEQAYETFSKKCYDEEFEIDKKKVTAFITHIKSFKGSCDDKNNSDKK